MPAWSVFQVIYGNFAKINLISVYPETPDGYSVGF